MIWPGLGQITHVNTLIAVLRYLRQLWLAEMGQTINLTARLLLRYSSDYKRCL